MRPAAMSSRGVEPGRPDRRRPGDCPWIGFGISSPGGLGSRWSDLDDGEGGRGDGDRMTCWIAIPGLDAARTRWPGCAERQACGLGAQVGRDPHRPRCTTTTTSSCSTADPVSRGSVSSGRARRSAISARYQASSSPVRLAGRAASSPAWTAVRGRVLRVGDVRRGPAVRGELPPPALADRRASSGSTWSVKYCHGVAAPHSSPMNSIGVNGEVSSRPGADLEQVRRQRRGDPVARWRGCRSGRGSAGSRGTGGREPEAGRPAGRGVRPRNDDQVPSWKNTRVSVLASAASEPKSP